MEWEMSISGLEGGAIYESHIGYRQPQLPHQFKFHDTICDDDDNTWHSVDESRSSFSTLVMIVNV
jgi:hypothetical protein